MANAPTQVGTSVRGSRFTARSDALNLAPITGTVTRIRAPKLAKTRMPPTPAGWTDTEWSAICAFFFEAWFSKTEICMDDQLALDFCKVVSNTLRHDGTGNGFM